MNIKNGTTLLKDLLIYQILLWTYYQTTNKINLLFSLKDTPLVQKGQGVFQIAENCGILKYRLLEEEYGYHTVVPSVVKKGATGKGNADKDMMYEAFVKELPEYNLKKILDTEKTGNPLSDIVDSYYIKKVGYENLSI